MLLWKSGLGLLLVALIGHVVGFACPYWMRAEGASLGLWQVCALGQCISFLSRLENLSVWFHAVQALSLAGMVLAIFSFLAAAVFVKSQNQALPLAPGMLTFTSGILVGTGLLIYAAKEWRNAIALDWAFFLECAVVGLLLLTSLIFLIAAARTKRRSRGVNLSVRQDKLELPVTEL